MNNPVSTDILKELTKVLEARKDESPDTSYVASLYAKLDKMREKIVEEATDTISATTTCI